jgi:hypothetical protein
LLELFIGWKGLALWFLPVLFFTELLYWHVAKVIHTKWKILVMLFVCSLLGYSCYLLKIHFWFKAEVVFTAIIFYGMGNFLGPNLSRVTCFSTLKLSVIAAILIVGSFSVSGYLPRLDMASNSLAYYIPTYIGSLFGIFFIFCLSIIFDKEPPLLLKNNLLFIGKNSLIIFMSFKKLTISWEIPDHINSIMRFMIVWIVMIFIIFLVNNYFPWLIGKNKINS